MQEIVLNTDVIDVASTQNDEKIIIGSEMPERGRNNSATSL